MIIFFFHKTYKFKHAYMFKTFPTKHSHIYFETISYQIQINYIQNVLTLVIESQVMPN